MTGWESIQQALRLLRVHPLRSALTLFGLVWGTGAVIFLSSWGAGLKTMNERAFQRAGKNLMLVYAGHVSQQYSPAVNRRILWFTLDDVKALRARARLPELVAGETRRFLVVAFHQRSMSLNVRGEEPEGIAIRSVSLAAGRSLSRSDVAQGRRVAVVGQRARERLLGAEGGVGSVVRLDGRPFEIVGVLARVGTQLARDGPEIDDQLWVPITTHLMLWPNDLGVDADVVQSVMVRLRDRHLLDDTEAEVRRILAARLGVPATDAEAVSTFSPVKLLRRIPIDEQNSLNFLIAATTILIAGVGVLTMMLDAVRERRVEIGIRLALGARRRDVQLQFFLETGFVVALGGLLGVALGIGGSALLADPWLRSGIPPALNDLVPIPELAPVTIGAAVSILIATGVLSALLPAWRASRIDPAITLRAD